MEKKTVEKKIKKTTTKTVEKKVEASASAELKLNPLVWDVPYNADLVAQVLLVQNDNARTGTAHAKDRSMVSGGGKKPWKQKGTGRARAGSSRSPIWVGGGVTFVPNYRNWTKKVNKKMVRKAIAVMLSQRLRENAIEFVSVDAKKSLKDLRASFVKEIDMKVSNLVIASDENVKRSLSNVEKVNYSDAKDFSIVNLVKAKRILVDKEVVKMIDDRLVNEK